MKCSNYFITFSSMMYFYYFSYLIYVIILCLTAINQLVT